jgi:predicted PurR-regulated permease PerM
MKIPSSYNFAVKLFIFVSVVAILIAGRQLFIPFMIALFFTFLLLPVSQYLEKKNIRKGIAIVISILLALIVFGSLVYFFVSQLASFKNDLPELKEQLVKKGHNLMSWIESNTRIPHQKQLEWFKMNLNNSSTSGGEIVFGIFTFTGTFLAMFALIPVYIFFMTYYREKYKTFLLLVAGDQQSNAIEIIQKISTVSKKYLKGLLIDILILSVLSSAGYLLLGIKHAILFGVIAAMLNIVPYIGAFMGGALPVMMALITKDSIWFAAGAIGVAAAVQFIDNNFLTPYIVGSSVSINPFSAIIALIAGALIWGLPGMILSIPIAGMLKITFDHIDSLKPYGFLIGEDLDLKKRQRIIFRKRFRKENIDEKN